MSRSKKIVVDSSTSNQEPISPLEDSNKIVNDYNIEKEELEEKPKKQRKSKKADESEKESAKLFAEGSTLALHLGINAILSRFPKVEPLSETEVQSFDSAFNALAIKYFPVIDRFGEEITFIATIAFIILPRLKFTKKENKSETVVETKDSE